MIEIDHDVSAFWHSALRDGGHMAAMIQEFSPTRDILCEWETSRPRCVKDHGFRTLVLNRTRRGGIIAGGASYMRKGENGKGLLSRWYPQTLARRLVEIERHADRLVFCEGDGMKLLPVLLRGWREQAAVFVDPPYTAGGKRAGRRLYTDSEIDHESLFSMLADSKADFLMTYDFSSEIVRLIREHGFRAVVVFMKNTHHNRLPELVITRRSLFT
jgi:DNA adenine methylase